MRSLCLSRMALCSCVAVAMLAGCGGSQPPMGTPGTIPQSRAIFPARATAHHVGSASSYSVVYSFGGHPDGATPGSNLVDVNGTLYGTTALGGRPLQQYGHGTVFSINTSGTERVLYRFGRHPDGKRPSASLIDVGGIFYGTTQRGGKNYDGTVFTVSTTGKEQVLYNFGSHPDAAGPHASLIDVRGTLYGTTYYGGTYNAGTIFSISTAGSEHVLHSFGSRLDGANPIAGLIDVGGKLYGTTFTGGRFGGGTVFSITATGKERRLHSFGGTSSDGHWPYAGLVDVNGTLYGTTYAGGAYNGGTVFSITLNGTEKVLHSFGNGHDGLWPHASLIEVNGTLYGTTSGGGGRHNPGTVFSISAAGTEQVLHSFGRGSDGANPVAGLIDVNGALYGTTEAGGTYGDGTVFALSP